MNAPRVIDSQGSQLAIYEQGASDRPTVLLVHGYPDDHQIWNPVVRELLTHFRVVTYDVRGSGASGRPGKRRDYRLDRLEADLVAVMDAVSPDTPVHLVAHDWGSIQSWEAVTNPELHQRIASFTSISGPCLDHMGHWLRDRLRRPTPRHLGQLFGQLLRSWYILLFHLPGTGVAWRLGLGRLWPAAMRWFENTRLPHRPQQGRDGQTGVKLYRANMLRRLLFPRQRHTQVPVQLILPDKEHFVSPHLFGDLGRWVPRLWVRRLSGNHWLPRQHPGKLAQAITDFVHAQQQSDGPALPRYWAHGQIRRDSGKLVVVTGAGSGIGRATALAYAEQGAALVVVDINPQAAERTATLARLLHATAWVHTADVGNQRAMETLVSQVLNCYGVPDIVVNNAGIGMAGGMLQTSELDWQQILHVNLWGVIHGARLFGKAMHDARQPGHIVNVASAAAFTPSRTFPAYATSKAAVLMLSECLRADFRRLGIRVNTICPGFVDTGIAMATRYAGADQEEQQRRRQKANRLYQRRGFTPEQVARAIQRAVARDRALTLVGIEAFGAHWLQRLTPTLSRQFARVDLSPH